MSLKKIKNNSEKMNQIGEKHLPQQYQLQTSKDQYRRNRNKKKKKTIRAMRSLEERKVI